MASEAQNGPTPNGITHHQWQPVLEDRDQPILRPLPHILDNGVTELWCPPVSTDVLADICFVHGLKGHPFKTWYDKRGPAENENPTAPKSKRFRFSTFGSSRAKEKQTIQPDGDTTHPELQKKRGCYWPLDFLPNDCANVRVITYGYDSHPSHFYAAQTNQMTITQHANNLLQQLTNNRIDFLTRPIIFVAHSLGGILVKDAIVQSAQYENHLKCLNQSCSAIFFFGTPHRGSSAARYGEILSNIVGALPGGFSLYKEILRGLKPDGEKLSLVEGDFNQLLNQNIPAHEKIQLYSFQEGKGLSSIKHLDGKIVPDSSSFFNRKDVEQRSHVNENHMDMARFRSANSSAYADFRSALKGFLARIQARERQLQTAAQKAEHARLAAECQVLKEILDFKERCVRQQQISGIETTQKTFDWIWTSSFKTWLEEDCPFFWISGKAASGKSTLMNYIAHSEKTTEVLQHAHQKLWKVIYFFFDFRARDGISNSFEGFLRCLLFQLCQDIPDLSQHVPELQNFIKQFARNEFFEKRSLQIPALAGPTGFPGHLPLESLKNALLQALASCSENILILLDGLDEYDGRQVELTNFIKGLHQKNIKICTASRPDPPFPDAFAGMPVILMQELNFDAIKSFGLDVLEKFYSARQYEPVALHALAEEVAQKSQGVFLWARFAVNELIEGLSRGERLGSAELEQRLAELPEELHQIYSRIFRRYAPAQRKIAALLLLLICYKQSDLTTAMLAKALYYVPSSWNLSSPDATTHLLGIDDSSFSMRLLAVTGGIVEVFKAQAEFDDIIFDCELPRLIHRTANTYLELGGWKELVGDMSTPDLGHKIWMQICAEAIRQDGSKLALRFASADAISIRFQLRFLRAQAFSDRENNIGAGGNTSAELSSTEMVLTHVPASETLLLAYAAKAVFEHATAYEKLSKVSCRRIIGKSFTPAFIEVHQKLSFKCNCRFLASMLESHGIRFELMNFSVFHMLAYYVDEFLQENLQRARSNHMQHIVDNILSAVGRGKSANFSRLLRFLKAQVVFSACKRIYNLHYYEDDWAQMLTLLLKYGATIENHELLFAVGFSTPRILRLLMAGRQSLNIANVDLKLLSWFLGWEYPQVEEFFQGKTLTLMAGLGLRIRLGNPENDREVLRILEEWGAHINDQCGPLGGVLHYAVAGVGTNPYIFSNPTLLELLFENSADVNNHGPRGKPLELLWQFANSHTLDRQNQVKGVRDTIRAFVNHGAVNECMDPNGLVPSEIQMRLFGCNWTDYLECQRYYREGPRDGSGVWPGPVPYNPKDGDPRRETFQIPYEGARREYRLAMGME
ncbi:uncharacterized protein A1O9_09213 [Exophiala aquamarina CBS 119918]|uniref:Nephrocystin 3-like N-terminal domain-containing protein n=1 Tax=Exophiala aquamarina CBS 119918 TaxID=1182545 RepID=A0A072P4N4_9EURO|nr:uncharacterized protein A1O9_09213 [Exophiala aquamarina CBS 119918]KEF54771.1 hypothetical protein A1O9_09213 [Exophiala aquamarina CBS 119918]